MKKNIFFKKKNIYLSQLFPNFKSKKNFIVNDVKPLQKAEKNDLTFFDSIKYKNFSLKTKSLVCITNKRLEKFLPKNIEKIIVENVLLELAKVLKKLYPDSDVDYIDNSLKIPSKKQFATVNFGNNVLVGKNVKGPSGDSQLAFTPVDDLILLLSSIVLS